MKKLKQLLSLFLLVFVPALVFSQSKTVTGRVTDGKDNSPLAEATVSVVGKSISSKTGPDGTFTISVPDGSKKLKVSYIGYADQTVNITGETMSIALLSSAQTLTDVVVIGYGTVRKKDATGAVASVKAKDFNQGVINSPDQLLQNKVAGLEITNTSGQPGAATTIQIRGNSSIRSSNNPLYVVDGVPLDGGTARPDVGTAFGNTPNSNPLLLINPFDIAQIDVLKDASSTAIYGSRGANGVVIITTKKGGSGPMKIDVGANVGIFAGYMKRFEILDAGQFRSALKKYLPDSVVKKLDGGQNTDALKEITQNTVSQNYSVALSGGNENGKFRGSFLASNNQGFLKNSSLKKYLASFNGQYKFIDNKLNLEFGLIAGNFGENLVSVSNTAGSTGNIVSSALSWNPTQPFKKANGLFNYPSSGSGNPDAFSDSYSDKSRVSTFLGHISAAYKILPNLEYKYLYGLNYQTGNRRLNIEGWLPGFQNLSGEGNAAIANRVLNTQVIDHTLEYTSNFSNDLTFTALAGYEYFKTDFSGDQVAARGFSTNLVETNRIPILYTSIMQNAKTQVPFSSFANPTSELQSYFGRVNFGFQNKYIITASVRSDGSSKFGSNHRYSFFPSGAFKWQVSNETFMKNSKVLSNLAVRVSYGATGNQEFPAGSSREQFALNSSTSFPQIVNGNPNLKWETTKQFNAGLDFTIGKGRIFGSIDYYNKNTSDILFQTNAIQPAPSSLSFINLPNANLVNSGIEVALGGILIEKKNLSWEVNANFSYNKNLIKNFTDPNTGLSLLINTGQINGQGVSGTLAQVITNNQPVNVFYLKQFKGFDAKGNQIIGDNPEFSGDPNPHMLAGLSTSVRYNKLTLSLNIGGAFGFKLYNNTATSITNIAGLEQGRNIDLAAYNSAEGVKSGVAASSRFLENGNYWKLRNATISYNVGNVGSYLKNLNAFVTGSNLFVITKFTGFDPEVNIDKSNNSYPSRSIEYVPYPTPRSITLGVNFSL